MDCFENSNISFNLAFIAYGSVAQPQMGKVFLDVGNQLCPGIIDHHQPGAEKECTVSLLLRYPHYVLDHLRDTPISEVTLVTHISPDLDATTAVFFCHALLTAGGFPLFARSIAAYVRDIDMGICFRRQDIVTVYSIFTAMCELIRRHGEDRGLSAEQVYRARVSCVFSLWEHVVSRMDDRTDLHSSAVFESPHPFQDAEDMVRQDHAVYLEDLKKGKKAEFTIPLKSGSGLERVDALLIADPESLLFRSWARGDSRHSPRGRGFTMLAVNFGNERYVISLDPQSPYYLKGLGDLLEEAENRKRKRLCRERVGENRPGYDSPDPWYDGRNPLHNYTIVDTPRSGTVLTWEEIKEIIYRFSSEYR